MSNIGFIGLGVMGKPMAGHLLAAGHSLFLYTPSGPSPELLAQGGVACASPRQVAEKADIIIAEAKDRTKQDMALAKRKLESEIVGLVAEATEVLTGEKVDKTKDASLINKALAEQVK